jgi:hypothetical protein
LKEVFHQGENIIKEVEGIEPSVQLPNCDLEQSDLERPPEERPARSWQLFTSHGLVLISILNHPGKTVRQISLELNLTDRAVALAIADLVADGYLVREKVGRRTFYKVDEDHPLKYPVSPYGQNQPLALTVRSLRAENLATHLSHLNSEPGTKTAASDKN